MAQRQERPVELNLTLVFKAPQGLLRCVVLAYASKYPVTGAELAADVRAKTGGLWDPSPGSVYFLMNELKDKGLLVMMSDSGPGRKAYITTDAGRSELAKTSRSVISGLQREVTLLALVVSMVDPANSARVEVLKSVLKADADRIARLEQQIG
jgi:DNA-binding PadR family transcriptional regulator